MALFSRKQQVTSPLPNRSGDDISYLEDSINYAERIRNKDKKTGVSVDKSTIALSVIEQALNNVLQNKNQQQKEIILRAFLEKAGPDTELGAWIASKKKSSESYNNLINKNYPLIKEFNEVIDTAEKTISVNDAFELIAGTLVRNNKNRVDPEQINIMIECVKKRVGFQSKLGQSFLNESETADDYKFLIQDVCEVKEPLQTKKSNMSEQILNIADQTMSFYKNLLQKMKSNAEEQPHEKETDRKAAHKPSL